ncbi:MAG: HAD family hydrolase [Spirulina sp. SIO3F2]|nr:HAD family hydrolase [Spirulina sp. SIO3F2]
MTNHLLALDFDGVICDGLAEYFQTTCYAYGELWPQAEQFLEGYREGFYAARPIIESGWEMPVMLRALVRGHSVQDILAHWPDRRTEILAEQTYDRAHFSQVVDAVRDRAIHEQLMDWLALHRFYPGVITQLQQWLTLPHVDLWIVSTKEGRFIAQLLEQAGVDLPRSQIIGKEIRQPKVVTLGQLRDRAPEHLISFVEDRLPPLQQASAIPELADVRLYLADWGYNTAAMRSQINGGAQIQLLSLEQFGQLIVPIA